MFEYTEKIKGLIIVKKDNPVKNKFVTKQYKKTVYYNKYHDIYFMRHNGDIYLLFPVPNTKDNFTIAYVW